MDYRYKELEQDLSALNSVFSELGSRLSEAVKDVTGGAPPSEQLIEQILTARTRFESVRSAVHNQAGAMLVSPLPQPGELGSIHAIGSLLKTTAAAEESKFSAQGEQERASNILSRVLAISHRETAAFQPLQDFHAVVTELRNAISNLTWPNRHPEAESIIGLRHPCTVLLNFVENLDNLEDEKWIVLEATITEAYGKALFVAASRGKLVAQPLPGKSPEQAKPVPAAEKPVERKTAPEKPVEKTVTAPAASAPVEKKEAPPTPVQVAPAPVASPVSAPAPAAVQAPAPPAPVAAPAAPAVAPISSITVPPRPPAPVQAPPSAPPPAVAPAASTPAVATSLSALANATDPATVTDRKPAGAAPSEHTDKGRKEPRLAVPPPPPPARTEPTSQEPEPMGDEASRAMAGDGTQRPQRWGFWRGNR